jgi:hypothetical protein
MWSTVRGQRTGGGGADRNAAGRAAGTSRSADHRPDRLPVEAVDSTSFRPVQDRLIRLTLHAESLVAQPAPGSRRVRLHRSPLAC